MKQKFKKGAASMYVVVIAALLFGVITVSFIRIVVSESLRTTNNELAQSAYDSALAGVEDAKVALMKYYGECKTNPSGSGCDNVKKYIDNAFSTGNIMETSDPEKCSTINNALARNGTEENTDEVLLRQTTTGNSNTEQAYTCVILSDRLNDYAGTLDSTNTIRVIPLKTATGNPGGVQSIKISWYDEKGWSWKSASENETDPSKYKFSENQTIPPVISAQLIQTDETFSLSDFESNNGDRTDRGTLFLAPVKRGSNNDITSINQVNDKGEPCTGSSGCRNALAFSNSHSQTNYPFLVKCKNDGNDANYNGGDYACSATVSIPEPYNGGNRNPETFFLVLTLPYGGPTANFSVEMCNGVYNSDGTCPNLIQFGGVQTMVDSTGRANDMFSRVEARIEMTDLYFPYAEFALQLSGDGTGINKNFYVTKNCWTNPGAANCSDSGDV